VTLALREIATLQPLYTVPGDDLVGEVLIPAMSAASSLRCMAGFFSSAAFRHVAPGIATFINATEGVFRLLISPALDDADREAIRTALVRPEDALRRAAEILLEGARLSESALEQHTLDCLSYLLAAGRLEIRFILMADGGMFHPKVWVFHDGRDLLVAHGSSNITPAGLLSNFEAVSVERSWAGEEAMTRTVRFRDLFERLWSGNEPDTLTLDLSAGLNLARRVPSTPPTIEDFWRAWHADAAGGLAPPLPSGRLVSTPTPDDASHEALRIPRGLAWESGPFAHQGRAVRAWEEAAGRGLLSMATGSGKTVTALICAARLQDRSDQPLLVVIAAPYRPLVEQWREEAGLFGVSPLGSGHLSSADRNSVISEAVRRLDRQVSSVEVAVVTHDYLLSDGFSEVLNSIPTSVRTLLIADEVHNLGRPRFLARPPEQFQYRIGLSATPVLQYNEAGTQAIADFFGDAVFEFGLAEAIGVCLVPYNYFLHPVPFAAHEMAQWDELTEKLVRAGFVGHDEGLDGNLSPQALVLLVKRRAVLEAAAAKVDMLRELLEDEGIDKVRHTLVYCSDKRPEQLHAVNRELLDLGLFVRQLTAAETADRGRTADILQDFGRGDYQVITCKRVLDEGVDLPQVRQAFLLASSTVRRQWVQRRGRILRRCDAIGKTIADLHDFLVVPDDLNSSGGRAIITQELDRARAFAELAANSGSPDGPFATIGSLSHSGDR
jgi:superfamily II DNA or RNA helicase